MKWENHLNMPVIISNNPLEDEQLLSEVRSPVTIPKILKITIWGINLNNPLDLDLPISQIEVEQDLVIHLEPIPIPTPTLIKVNQHLSEVRLLDKKIIDRITLFLPTGEIFQTSMRRLIEMKLKYPKPDRGVDLEHLPNILMFFNRVILLLSKWVEDDLPDPLEIRCIVKYLIKMIESDLLPKMIEHRINDIEKIEDLLIMRVTLEFKLKLRSVIEDQSLHNMFEMITKSLDPDL
jgi:hypothetical protein